MGCCNERGVLRPLLSGGGSSRSSRNNNTNNEGNSKNHPSRFGKLAKRQSRVGKGNNKTNGISHQSNRHGVTNSSGGSYTQDGDHIDYDDYEFTDDDEEEILGYSEYSSGNCCHEIMGMFRKIGLLVWKNLLLRRRHYIVTALEILLPTLFAMILAAGKTQTGASKSIDPTGNTTITFPIQNELALTTLLGYAVSCAGCYIAYTPESSQTIQIMQEVSQKMQRKVEFRPFKDEDEIEKVLASMNFNQTNRNFRGAVVFQGGLDGRSKLVSYKIRLVDSVHDTDLLFPWFQLPGPNTEHTTRYSGSGFTGLQLLLDRAISKLLTGKDLLSTVSLQAFPYPPFKITVDFSLFYFILLPQLFVLGFIFMVPSIIRVVVSEKETGIRELLKLNGLPGWMQWLGWMMNSMIVLSISITIVVFLLFWTFDIEAGAVLVHSDPTVWWVVLFLYSMSASSFCFFISSFRLKPTLATTLGIILWLASYYFLFVSFEKQYQMSSFIDKIGVCLLPNMAMHLAIKVMSAFEGKAVGAHWYNIAEPISSVDPLSLGFVILMFLVNTCMYMLLTVYVENVFPSEYGVRKPWYYIFQLKTWWRPTPSSSRSGPTYDEETDFDPNANIPGFETEPSDLIVGISIKNLQKRFGRNKVAVDGVSAKMYDGEIFALLGHNGAGKTTTISMLTGLFAPSGGTATVNGFSITTDLDQVRQNLGLCPQHNMLFDKLTVLEHLRFFGQLKGLSSAEALKESMEILQKLQLSEKANTLSLALSGGQKRKLSLGIALIGGTKVVILDEPTSGMDPEARRAIWDLLLEMRGHRTILLTTHFMEEADVLGDRIGIMASGKLQCCGTPIFLKKFYGTGYTLKMSTAANVQPNDILSVIQNHVPNASVKSTLANNATELLVTLPTETATTSTLSEMFSQISARKDELGIKSIGLSLTTMDEVFVRVGELAEDHGNGSENGASSSNGSPEVSHKATDERLTLKPDEERPKGLRLAFEQFMALLTKKYLYAFRKRKLMLCQLICPILILIMSIRVSNSNFETPDPPPQLRITLDSYKLPVTLYSAFQDAVLSSQMAGVIGTSARKIPDGSTLPETLDLLGRTDLASYRERHIIALDGNTSNINAMFSSIPNHAAPLAINLATNTLLKSVDPVNNFRIQVTNHPLQSQMEALIEAAEPDPIFSETVPILFAVFMPIGLALLAASFIVFPIEEKLCKAKQLQVMTGVSPLIYWSSAFVWDFITVFIVICVMTACFPIFQTFDVFTSYGGAGVAFLILLVYGFSAISFSYLVSLFSTTVAGGFAFVTILHIATGIVMCIIVHVMEMAELASMANKFRWVARIFPTFGAAISTMRFTELATKNGRCNILSLEAKKLLCDPKIFVPPEYRECCDNCQELGASCFKPTPYITWGYEKSSIAGKVEGPGIGQELLFMIIMAVVYQVLLILLEYGVIQFLISKVIHTDESVFDANINDEDVLEESQRVNNMVTSGDVSSDSLVVNNLCKTYGNFAAVSKLSFGVHHGECFGLLGVNGAGKTTSFRMLTGDEFRSCGNAYAFMNNLSLNRKSFLSNIGYCPQFDGIIGVLTGREMLQLFCRLRGVPGRYGKQEAEKWLNKLGLAEAANVQCQKYSGGMKRRLCVAMAMIGDPPLLLLDEPTSGVDPVSRRQFWKVLETVKNKGQSIILTSHSMEECEALCSRLGIMVNGQLQCFGGVQHLKAKFAQGYSLSVKLKPLVPVESDRLNTLSAAISETFAPCTLKDKHQSILQYQVHNTTIPWDGIFNSMEDLKKNFNDIIEDYSVNETTLEEVFLSFARMQYGDRKANVSIFKRLLTCQC